MTTVTIPQEFTKSRNFVAVPQDVYEEFLAWQRKIKSARIYEPTAREKKALARSRKNFRQGKYITFDELRHELAIDR